MGVYTFEPLGERLRSQREQIGLTLRQVADKTRIPYTILEDIERGDPTNLPAPVFVKGFLRSYALELGLTPEEVIGDYKSYTPEQETAVAVPVTARKPPRYGFRSWILLVVVVILIAAGTGVVYFYPKADFELARTNSINETTDRTAVSAPAPVAAPVPTEATAAGTPAGDEAATDIETEAEPVVETAPETAAAPETAPEAATAAPAAETAAAGDGAATQPTETAAPAGNVEHELKLVFEDEVWIRLKTEDGKMEHGLFQPGMSKTWRSKNGFSLRIGNAGGVRVIFDGEDLGVPGRRGKAIDLNLPKADG